MREGDAVRFEEAPYVPTGSEFRDVPAAVVRAFGSDTTVVRHGDVHVGWVDGRGGHELALFPDGGALVRTGVSGARAYAVHRAGDTITVPTGRRVFRVNARDGAVEGFVTCPDADVRAAATLSDGRALLLVAGEGLVRCREEDGTLVPERAWRFEGADALRLVGEGRAALVLGDPPARASLWWFDGDDARELLAKDDFDGFVTFDGALDESGRRLVRPAQLMVWDGGSAHALAGVDALAPDASSLAAAPFVPSMELPDVRAAIPWHPPNAPAAPPRAPTVPRPQRAPSGAYTAALYALLRERPERAQPDASLAPLLASALPDDLHAIVAAAAWHGVPHVSLGEFWLGTPAERTDARAAGGAAAAVHLGVIANGDDVVARVASGAARVFVLSHEEDDARDRGSIESFLRACVAYARERGEATSLDARLPADDRDG